MKRFRALPRGASRAPPGRLTVVAVALALASCATPLHARDLLVPEGVDLRPRPSLSAADVDRDLELLQLALQRAYAGRFIFPQAVGEASARLEALRGQAALRRPAAFCEAVQDALEPLPDAHLRIIDPTEFCPARPRPARRNVGANTAGRRLWAVEERAVHGRRVTVVGISRCAPIEDPDWGDFIERVTHAMNSSDATVLDLRGNGGGNDAMLHELATLILGVEARLPVSKQVSDTPESRAIWFNQFQLQVELAHQSGEAVPKHLRERVARSRAAFERSGEAREPSLEPASPKSVNRPTARKPLAVVFDRRCSSSCEDLIEYLEPHSNQVTVGDNSGGFIAFGNVGIAWLFSAGFGVQLATTAWHYHDGRELRLERVGHPPDVRVDDGADALDVALEAVAKLPSLR